MPVSLPCFLRSLGIWAGQKIIRKKVTPDTIVPPPAFQSSEAAMAKFGITPRELEVLQLIALGHSNQEIADQLFVSLNTIKTHISNVLAKLDAERRTQAIQKAKTLGLLPKWLIRKDEERLFRCKITRKDEAKPCSPFEVLCSQFFT